MISQSQEELITIGSALCSNQHKSLAAASALFTALQAKHAPTAYHSLRVAQNLTAWGLFHHIDSELLCQIEILGLLHDVGKIGVPERILQKPDVLTEQERAIIHMHPKVGAEILKSSGLEACLVESVYRLGEWYNCESYNAPETRLPVHGRALAVADAYDAMISVQRYRPAMSLEHALEELERLAGYQFDPDVVMTFAQVARSFDADMRAAVKNRWMNFGFDHSAVELFQNSANRHTNGVIDNSLNSLFHRRLADHMNDGVIFIDTEGKILEWNRAAENITGNSRSSICHLQWKPELIDIHDETGLALTVKECPLLAVMHNGGYEARRLSLKHCDGSRRAIQVRVLPVNDDHGTCRGAAMVFDDITRQKNLEQAVEKLHIRASKDQLTKVNNRAELNLQLPKLTKDVHDGSCLACVIICDIDFFKRINDTYGHAAGDEALVAFASILQRCSRNTDLVTRYGGEEFVILCRDCTLEDAYRKAEEIRRTVAAQPLAVIRGKCMTASFGVAEITTNTTGEQAINAADAALLRAKGNGRNRVERTESNRKPGAVEHKPPSEPRDPKSNSWLSWLSINSSGFKQQVDIIVTVPPELAIEKLRGFLADWQAQSVNYKEGMITLTLDLRKAPAYLRANDRDVTLNMAIQIRTADYLPQDEREAASQRTLITATLKSTSKRDRRTSSLEDQMQRVFVAFNRYLVGEILDTESRKCIRIHSRQ